MEWAVLLSTIILSVVAIILSVVAIVTTRWYGREAGKCLEEMKTILSRMDKEVLEKMKGILEEIRRGVHHLVGLGPKHKHKKKRGNS